MNKDLATLVAYVGAFNVLIHLRETCRSLKSEEIIGPESQGRALARSGRTIAQKAVAQILLSDDENANKVIFESALGVIHGIALALKAMDSDSFKIAAVLDQVE